MLSTSSSSRPLPLRSSSRDRPSYILPEHHPSRASPLSSLFTLFTLSTLFTLMVPPASSAHPFASYAASLHPSTHHPTVSASSSTSPLVVVGSINADLVVRLDRLPKKGETVSSSPNSSLQFYPGGKGANQAVAASNLGHPTQFVGQVGQDMYAPLLREALRTRNIDTSMIHTVPDPATSSGIAFIMLQPDGENSIVIIGGANTSEEWQITDDVTSAIQSAGVVLLQREIPESVNVIFAKLATSARVPVILDAGGADTPLCSEMLSNVSILSPNETELHRLTGMPTRTEKECVKAAESLVHAGVNKVLVKLGSKGSLLVDIYGNVVRQKACAVDASCVVDTTGAGDCFTAAFAVAMLEGKGDAEAMAWASKAASLCIQRRGAIPSMPRRDEM